MPATLQATTEPTSIQPPESLAPRLVIANDGPSLVHVAVGRDATTSDMAIAPMMIGQIPYPQRGALLSAITASGMANLRISSPAIPGLSPANPGNVPAGGLGFGAAGSLGAQPGIVPPPLSASFAGSGGVRAQNS